MVLVDSSVWIEYFRGSKRAAALNDLIDSNNLCVNDLILAELLPAINHHKESQLQNLLLRLTKSKLTINWQEIIEMQTKNLHRGINKVGIPDLIIAQNALNHDLTLFSYDKHFQLMQGLFGLRLY